MGVYLPLPSAYQEVEYIKSSWTQYINTGYIPTIYDSIEVKFKTETSSSDTILYGSRRRNTSNLYTYEDFSVRINTSSGKGIAVHYPKDWTTAGGYTDTSWIYTGNIISNPHTLKVTPNYCYVDWALVYTFNVTRTAYNGTYPSRIFGMNSNLSSDYKLGKFTVYYLKIWNNNTLVRDFVPCYRKSDNVIWLYDLVNSQFYTNSWTGTFSKWADVTAIPLKNAYIGQYYEYSYDFRGKSISQATADGWTLGSGVSIDANWAGSNTWSSTVHPIWHSIINAKKIILTCWLYNANAMNSSYQIQNTASSSTNACWVYLEGYSSNYSTFALNGTQQAQFTISEPSWQSSWTYTLDFENLTYNLVYWTVYTKSWTMAQSQADAIRNNNTYLRFAVQYWTWRIQYVKIEVSL